MTLMSAMMVNLYNTEHCSVWLIPNTAVFGPTNFIGTTIASTTRMRVYADEKVSTDGDFYFYEKF